MPDMLVKLYELPETKNLIQSLASQEITIAPPDLKDRERLLRWVSNVFTPNWVDEFETSFNSSPPTSLVAIKDNTVIGFACYNCTAPNFFGPTGVEKQWRGKGIGKALLISCLQFFKDQGYGYAIIGGVGPTGFYEKAVGATVIEGSVPGIYAEK